MGIDSRAYGFTIYAYSACSGYTDANLLKPSAGTPDLCALTAAPTNELFVFGHAANERPSNTDLLELPRQEQSSAR